jgi:hypothetical protein
MSNLLFDRISQRASSLFVTTIISVLALSIIPTTALAKPIKIGTAMTFDFKGCTKSSGGQDIICVGNFRNRDADKRISVSRKSSFVTDFDGKSYAPDELRISDQLCRSNCLHQYITLVEGVDYKASFLFKDVSLSSPKIALFQINTYYGGFDPIKIRRIKVSSSRAEDTNENSSSSLTDQQELQNTVKEVEKQEQDRIAAAQAEQEKKDNEAALKRMQSTTPKKKPKTQQKDWLSEQLNQGVLDLFGKPRKPGQK